MSFSMVASHSTGKVLKDVIFGASAACNEAIQKYGADKVTNGTIGAIMDDEGKLICIQKIKKQTKLVASPALFVLYFLFSCFMTGVQLKLPFRQKGQIVNRVRTPPLSAGSARHPPFSATAATSLFRHSWLAFRTISTLWSA